MNNKTCTLNRFRILGIALAFLGLSITAVAETPTNAPNILFLFADDLDPGVLERQEARTPHINTIAEAGVQFNSAYNMGGWHGAICVASRAMLMTGAYVWEAQALEARLADVVQQEKIWPQHMAAAGYETYFSGKWHLPVDPATVFDHTASVRMGGMPAMVDSAYHRPPLEGEDPWKPWDESIGGFWEGGQHWSEVLAEDGLAFLEQAQSSDKPFFMYLSFNAPHDPRQAPREFVDQYPPHETTVPPNFLPVYPHHLSMGCGPDLRDEKLAPFPRTEKAIQVHRSEYLAIVAHMDAQIGRILDALRASGKAENTIVVFAADNGLACGQHGLLGKQNMYEHSMRVPLLVAGPGIERGQRIAAPIYMQDILPTLLAWAQAPVWDSIAYQSLIPLLTGEEDTGREVIYGAYMKLQRMLVADRFKLIHYPKSDTWRLFDLDADPWEMNDLAAQPEKQDRLAQLQDQLAQTQRQMNDPLSPAEQDAKE